jgi:hypothetical protein
MSHRIPFVDFICDSPVDVVRRMHQTAERFRSLHPNSWDNSLIFSSAKTPDELSAPYESAKFPKMALFLSPETYQYTEGRTPFVPDLEHLRRVKSANLPLGVKIMVGST